MNYTRLAYALPQAVELAAEVDAAVQKLRLAPKVRTTYRRCAFQSSTSNWV